MKDTYTKAVLALLKDGTDADTVLKGLTNALAARGHERLYANILRAVLRQLDAHVVATTPVVTVASEADLKHERDAIANALRTLDASETYDTEIDDSLIGGFTATANGREIDQSYKSALLRLYRQIIA